MSKDYYEREHHHRKERRHHWSPDYRTTMTSLIIMIVALFSYLTWLSYQPPSWEKSCEKTHFHDGNHEVLWKCPAGDEL